MIVDLEKAAMSFEDVRGFYEWLDANHLDCKECYVLVDRGNEHKPGHIPYFQAVYAAICFGWIDSAVYSAGDLTVQRFTPRRKGSRWSELNKERARRMEQKRLMKTSGQAVLPNMTTDLDTLFPGIMRELRSHPEVMEKMAGMPPLYIRVRLDNIQSAATGPSRRYYRSRLDKFIKNTSEGVMYGEWNDSGNLD